MAAISDLNLENPKLVGTILPSRMGLFIFDFMPKMVASFVSLVSLFGYRFAPVNLIGKCLFCHSFYSLSHAVARPEKRCQRGTRHTF